MNYVMKAIFKNSFYTNKEENHKIENTEVTIDS